MDLYQKVFSFDKRIRYCATLDELGGVVSGGMRPGLKSLEPNGEAKKVDLQVVVARGMNETTQEFLGKTDYLIVHREKMILFAFPRDDKKTVLVTAEPGFPPQKAKELLRLVDKYYRG